MKKSILRKASTLIFLMTSSVMIVAQEAGNNGRGGMILDFLYNNIFFLLAVLVLIGIGVTIMKLITTMMDLQKKRMMDEMGLEASQQANLLDDKTFLDKAYDWLWSIVPVGQEESVDLGHDYDGIRELDNRLPPWWLLLFYGSIVFGFVYMYYYHWSGNNWSSAQEYEIAMEEAEIQKALYLDRMANLVNENSVVALADDASIAEGAEIYKANCLACHGALGEGGVGPNFTDPYWIHGGGIKNVFKTIKYGVPEKGMISWKSQLKPAAMQKVASFILTLEGTNPPNQKAKEGELWTEQPESEKQMGALIEK